MRMREQYSVCYTEVNWPLSWDLVSHLSLPTREVEYLDALLLTHDHADAILGADLNPWPTQNLSESVGFPVRFLFRL